jgi:glycosyltransferase involved in cell wall biosynthesis
VPAVVSVVIPTRDRPTGLSRLLAALARQSLPADRFEVIVVDDGSTPPVREMAYGPGLRILRNESSRGPGAARNCGWRAATTPLVAFVDDDCVPVEGWLEAFVSAARTAGADAILQGQVQPAPDRQNHLRPLSHTIEVSGPSRLFVSANIAYPRALLEQLNGFDERFRRAGEDAELGARALKAEARAEYVPGALVHHEVRDMSLAGHLRHTAKWTDAVGAVAMHPELRELLAARLFWKPTHPWLMGATAALLARRPRLAAVLALPYLRHYWRLYAGHRDELAWALPQHVVIDTWEVATAVRGSLQHRTIML